jgi:hypothetical protein
MGLMVGTLEVSTSAKTPGAVSNEEGLFGPISPYKMRYRVTRKLNTDAEITVGDRIAFYAALANQRTGTTTAKTLDGHTVNVTPYVGPKPGTCRHADWASLKTTTGWGKGTASYKLS